MSMTSTYNADVLRQKLTALTARTNAHSFLTITEPSSRKYVQFAGRKLFFDLPMQTLSDAEMARARDVLKRYGLTGPVTYRLGENSKGSEQTSFQKDLAGDISQAIAMVEAVFFEVYGFTRSCSMSYDEH
jgi:hypothetical protein